MTKHIVRGALSLIMACAVVTSAIDDAVAQDNSTAVQVEHFEPLPPQGTNILNTAKSDILGHLVPSGGLFVHYVNDPLQLVAAGDEDDVQSRVIANQLKTEL